MLLLTLAAALFAYATASICPDGFELIRKGQCHMQIGDAVAMSDSKGNGNYALMCAARNFSDPVIIHSQEDNDYWMSIAKENRKKGDEHGNVMLGLYCASAGPSTRWVWEDGSPLDFKPNRYPDDLDQDCDPGRDSWSYTCLWSLDPERNNWRQFCGLSSNKATMDLYCVYTPMPPARPDSDCAEFKYENDDGVCYQIDKTAANFDEAETICSSFGANVASIHTEQENAFVRRLAVSKGLVSGVLLGGKGSSKNTMKWADGSDWDYDNFAPNFPVASAGDCLALDTSTVTGQWKNVGCNRELPVACVRPTHAPLPTCDGALHKEGDIIYSPGFPSSASESCDYLLKVDPGMLVEVEILFLEANECCDHLELFEGPLGGNRIADLTGELQSGLTFRTATQNVMRASWQPQGGINVRGMMFTFRGVPKQ